MEMCSVKNVFSHINYTAKHFLIVDQDNHKVVILHFLSWFQTQTLTFDFVVPSNTQTIWNSIDFLFGIKTILKSKKYNIYGLYSCLYLKLCI